MTAAVDMTSQGFHTACAEFIDWWRQCVKKNGERLCILGFRYIGHTFPKSWNATGQPMKFLRFRNSLYVLYLTEWLAVIPRNNLLVIKFEDMISNSTTFANDLIYPFLGLDKTLHVSDNRPVNVNNWIGNYMPVLPETKAILKDFLAPYNQRLATLLKDDRFKWVS